MASAVLAVSSGISLPVISAGPVNISVEVGAAAVFRVTASGTGLNYEWRRGTPQSSVPAPRAVNSATYTTPPTSQSDNGSTYFVVVSSLSGSTTSSVATLNLLAAPPTGNTQIAMTAGLDAVRPGQPV